MIQEKKKKGPFLQKALMPYGDPWHAYRTKGCALENKENKPVAVYGLPSPEPERQLCDSQSQRARGCCSLGPRDCSFHQTVSRLPVANRVFLGSWAVHICQECHGLRSAPQRSHTAHLELYPHLGNQAARPGKCIKFMAHLGAHQAPSLLSGLDQGRAQNSQPFWVCGLVEHLRT